jgi:PAS domain S-box-containing protein
VLSSVVVMLLRRQARMREDKRRSESRYRIVVDQAGDGVCMVDAATGRLTEANSSLLRRLGYRADEILELNIGDLLVETPIGRDTAAFARLTNTRSCPRTIKQRCKNGQLLDVEVTVSHFEIDGRQMLCYIAHDVTERKNIELELLRNQRRLNHLAHHDALTGLPNRLFLRTHLEQALQAAALATGSLSCCLTWITSKSSMIPSGTTLGMSSWWNSQGSSRSLLDQGVLWRGSVETSSSSC